MVFFRCFPPPVLPADVDLSASRYGVVHGHKWFLGVRPAAVSSDDRDSTNSNPKAKPVIKDRSFKIR